MIRSGAEQLSLFIHFTVFRWGLNYNSILTTKLSHIEPSSECNLQSKSEQINKENQMKKPVEKVRLYIREKSVL